MKKALVLFFGLLLAAGCNQTQPVVSVTPTPTPLSGAAATLSGVTGTLSVPTPSPSVISTPVDESKTVYLQWTFKKLPDGAYDEPFSQIGLKLSGAVNKTVDLGKLSGCQTNVEAPGTAPKERITSLFCWWAGAGDQLTVNLSKPDELTVYREEMGEDPESTGSPYIIKTIAIPKGLTVEMKASE
jgi:hypothetical protein